MIGERHRRAAPAGIACRHGQRGLAGVPVDLHPDGLAGDAPRAVFPPAAPATSRCDAERMVVAVIQLEVEVEGTPWPRANPQAIDAFGAACGGRAIAATDDGEMRSERAGEGGADDRRAAVGAVERSGFAEPRGPKTKPLRLHNHVAVVGDGERNPGPRIVGRRLDDVDIAGDGRVPLRLGAPAIARRAQYEPVETQRVPTAAAADVSSVRNGRKIDDRLRVHRRARVEASRQQQSGRDRIERRAGAGR